ncbi:Rv3654c family TadE-like protein [Streptomyces lateritius]|uniref:Rv3654c family TadE-like protein n=1 Tax=Streptomyces lateritius TaxID=67313 RepID=A0ABW6Y612_9ACTN
MSGSGSLPTAGRSPGRSSREAGRTRPAPRPSVRKWRVPRPGAGDEGMATVWTAFVACALCVVFGAVLALGQAVAARHRAGGAADLAALAAADRALWGERGACEAAARVAGAQGAALVRCSVRGDVADVTAAVALGPYRPAVRARAGPAGPPEGLRGPPAAVP